MWVCVFLDPCPERPENLVGPVREGDIHLKFFIIFYCYLMDLSVGWLAINVSMPAFCLSKVELVELLSTGKFHCTILLSFKIRWFVALLIIDRQQRWSYYHINLESDLIIRIIMEAEEWGMEALEASQPNLRKGGEFIPTCTPRYEASQHIISS